MSDQLIWTPDTSTLNRLMRDPDSFALIAGLRIAYYVRTTCTSIGEVVANSDSQRRARLRDICEQLIAAGDCIEPQHEIIRKLVTRFEAPGPFNWREVSVQFEEVRDRQLMLGSCGEEVAAAELREQNERKQRFLDRYERAKVSFDRVFQSGADFRPQNLPELVDRLQVPGGAFWAIAGDLYARAGKNSPSEPLMRRFVAECDPFRAFMVALCAAQYDLCIRSGLVGPSFRSGLNDTLMAICLPYCDQFVTNDKGQLECYKQVAEIARLDVTIRSYDEFRADFLIRGRAA